MVFKPWSGISPTSLPLPSSIQVTTQKAMLSLPFLMAGKLLGRKSWLASFQLEFPFPSEDSKPAIYAMVCSSVRKLLPHKSPCVQTAPVFRLVQLASFVFDLLQ